ncbi:MAG: formylglycine-generating enzyme family protein, partial [Proteobacteria bacterium]|nr:formylglycine-generating enzyme family protein [Pseudomonadota bacterium]
ATSSPHRGSVPRRGQGGSISRRRRRLAIRSPGQYPAARWISVKSPLKNCLNWYEALAFCAWDGGFLPTEAEWNYAASGGTDQRAYPWSNPAALLGIDDTRASYYVDTTKQCFGDGVNGCGITDLIVVGTKPAGDGRWGQSDLGGNVWEWVLDWYASPYPQNPCPDCANLTPATYRVLRGGGFSDGASFLRAGYRNDFDATLRDYNIGLRCARTP